MGRGCASSTKRLDRGTFRGPKLRGDATTVQLSEAEFDELVAGLEAVVAPRKVKARIH